MYAIRSYYGIFDEPGMATSRIAFSRLMGDGVQEIYLVDSDGENMRRLTNNGTISKSPAWHPSGQKIAYVQSVNWQPHQIFQLDLVITSYSIHYTKLYERSPLGA